MNEQQQNNPITVYDNNSALCHGCAELICQQADAAIAAHNVFHLVLSGGSTPKALYQLLASDQYRHQLDWTHVHLWFGDERSVPHDHPDSNFLMAQQALIEHIPIAEEQVHAMAPLPDNMSQAAQDYQTAIEQHVRQRNNRPVFDLVLLGLGPDGHTASLFPDTNVLNEESAWVSPVYVDKLESWRLTLTYPVLENAQQLLFIVSGRDKAPVIKELFQTDCDLPSARLQYRGNTRWYLDVDAAQGLPV